MGGVFGQVFCDFGESFVVSDPDGNPPSTSQIESVLMENPAVVKVLDDSRHGLETNDVVTFARLVGLDGIIEEKVSYPVKVTGPYTFELIGVDLSKETPSPNQQGYITQ